MPFCRKCGRRLIEYSKRCPDCGTSTTAPLIKIKKASTNRGVSTNISTKVAKAIIPVKATLSVKVINLKKPEKVIITTKSKATVRVVPPKKPVTPAVVYPPHEIIKSNVSIKNDLIANPLDYEKQAFDFDLKCPNGHFWSAGKALPVSNGKAYCLKCGERLRKPKPNKRRRFHRL